MEKADIKVSVRCLVYNHAPYLRRCLEGFVMQRTSFKFEVVVHDDASTDGSDKIILEYAERFPDIINPIIETENQYSKRDGSLRRIMNEACSGKYFASCEGDDYWIDPFKLQKQYDFMESHPNVVLCGTNGFTVWDNGEKPVRYFNNIYSSRYVNPSDIIGNWLFPTPSLFYRKSLTENYPQWSRKIYSGDQTLALVALSKGDIYAFADCTCVYRQNNSNPNSMTNRAKKNKSSVLSFFSQHILLYESFDEYTNRKFHETIAPVVKRYKSNYNFFKIRDSTNILLAGIIYPCVFFEMVRTKFHNLDLR